MSTGKDLVARAREYVTCPFCRAMPGEPCVSRTLTMTDLRALAPAVGHMPGRGAGRLAWQTQAACRPGFTELPVARQKQICRGCPVVAECMRYATSDPAFGKGWRHGTSEMVYAGFTLAELAQAMGVEECRQ